MFTESRNWLPRIPKILPEKKQDSVRPPPPDKPSGTNDNSQSTTVSGNYNPNNNAIFKALHLIENEIFYSSEPTSKSHRIIQDALVYLSYTIYDID